MDPVSGKIYVANNDGHRSVAVFDSALDRIGSLPHTFAEPVGVTFDGASGTVYVADRGAHLVQTFVADEYAFDVAAPADLQTLTVNMSAGRVQDRAGNPNVESNSASIYIDRTTRPSPTNASTIGFTVTWDERVNGFAAGDITVLGTADHGGVANFAGSGSLYTFDVVPTSDGTVRPEIAAGVARNALGNLNVAAVGPSITYEGTPPVPVITPVQQGPTNLQTVSFRMGFDKYMDAGTIEASDIVASSGTVQNMRFAPQHERNTGGLGTGNGQFFFPYGMALNGTGHLFVADSVNDRVAVYTPDLVHIDNITDNDAGDLLEEPLDVAINGTGHIFVASTDAYQIAVFDSAFRNIANITGGVGSGPQRFDEAYGVAVNGTGHIFVAGGNDRIQVFDRARNHVASIGSADANNPDFNSPRGMAFNGTGHLYVADRGNSRVAIYNPALDHTGDIPVRILAPTDVAIDGTTGNIYVVESALDSVQIFDSANRHIGTISDRIDPLGDKPTGAAVDSTTGTLYVTDQGINGVQLFNVNAYAFDVADPADQQTLTVTLPTGPGAGQGRERKRCLRHGKHRHRQDRPHARHHHHAEQPDRRRKNPLPGGLWRTPGPCHPKRDGHQRHLRHRAQPAPDIRTREHLWQPRLGLERDQLQVLLSCRRRGERHDRRHIRGRHAQRPHPDLRLGQATHRHNFRLAAQRPHQRRAGRLLRPHIRGQQ